MKMILTLALIAASAAPSIAQEALQQAGRLAIDNGAQAVSSSGGFRVSDSNVSGPSTGGSLTTANSAGTPAGTVTVNNSTGGGGSHENRPPYFALNYIIKY